MLYLLHSTEVLTAINKWFIESTSLSLSLSPCSFNASIVVSSVGGGEVRVPVDVSLTWPNLVKEKLVTLEPTTVGNTSVSVRNTYSTCVHTHYSIIFINS